MLTKLNHVLLAGAVALACSSCQTEKKADYQVIPLPQEVVLTQEKPFLLNKNVSITYPEGNLLLKRNAEFLSGYIRQATGYTPPVKGLKDGETAKHAINLGLDADIANKEGYVLNNNFGRYSNQRADRERRVLRLPDITEINPRRGSGS